MEGLPELEHYLRTARVLDVATFPNPGAHKSFRVILEGGVGVLAKPANHAPDEGAAMVRYEVAGWVVARDLGWTDLVATTVLRTLELVPDEGEVEASLQVLWPSFQVDADIAQFSDEDVWKAAIFDTLVLHSDRTHNWGAVPGHGRLRLKLIDHGFAFRQWPGRPFSSSFEEARRGQELPDELRDQLEEFVAGCETSELAAFLEPEVLDELVGRGRHFVETGNLHLP